VRTALPTPVPTALPPTAQEPAPPIAQFIGTPTEGKVPFTVKFTDQSTGSPDAWSWNFGDGNISHEQNPAHQYTISGSYSVKLVASNSGGSNSENKIYYITANAAFQSPGAAYDVLPPTTTQPKTVEFIDRSSGPPTSWYWEFGDGATSDLQNPVHTYSGPGTYIVSLHVSNSAGHSVASGYVVVP